VLSGDGMHHHPQGVTGTAALVVSGLLAVACGVIVFTGRQEVACAPAPEVVTMQVPTAKPTTLSMGDQMIVRVLANDGDSVDDPAPSKPATPKPAPPKPAPKPETPITKPPEAPPSAVVAHPPPSATVVVAPPSDAPGFVRIQTMPWGWASVPGQRIETMAGKLTLPPGKHTIFLECGPECSPPKQTTRTVIVKPQMTQNISLDWDVED
jgi:hypothetical protein